MFKNNQALIVVDMQVDFCDGGSLAVTDSCGIVADLNTFIEEAVENNVLVVFTKDMHPKTHKSFVSNGGLWPEHCVANTKGSEFHPDLYIPDVFLCVYKGTHPSIEGYSAFEDTNLCDVLKRFNIKELLITGLATDYCVLQTACDASKLGFETVVVKNLTKAFNSDDNSLREVVEYLQNAKVKVV